MHHRIFATIITSDFLHFALALYDSIRRFDNNTILYILVSDATHLDENLPESIRLIFLNDLLNISLASDIIEKYGHQNNELRWSLKPVLLNYLLTEVGHQKVIFTDPDIYFVGDYNFLFEELNSHPILLTPHWRSIEPEIMNHPMLYNHAVFNHGLFNGGFIATNHDGIPFLNWWAKACLSICKKEKLTGHYDDQRYLDFAPIYFDAKILAHKGCNLAEWNFATHLIELDKEKKVIIDKNYRPIFIHFTLYYYSHPKSMSTCCYLSSNKQHPLYSYLIEYRDNLKKYKPEFDLIVIHEQITLGSYQRWLARQQEQTRKENNIKTIIRKIKHKLIKATVLNPKQKH